MSITRGQFVRLTYAGTTIRCMVLMASENERSLMLGFEGALMSPSGSAFLGMIPLLRDEGATDYYDLVLGVPAVVEPEPPLDPDYLARAVHQQRYGHQERRVCTAEAPMPEADKDRYRWHHPGANVVERITKFANAVDLCHCPHCGLTFTSFPRPQ